MNYFVGVGTLWIDRTRTDLRYWRLTLRQSLPRSWSVPALWKPDFRISVNHRSLSSLPTLNIFDNNTPFFLLRSNCPSTQLPCQQTLPASNQECRLLIGRNRQVNIPFWLPGIPAKYRSLNDNKANVFHLVFNNFLF